MDTKQKLIALFKGVLREDDVVIKNNLWETPHNIENGLIQTPWICFGKIAQGSYLYEFVKEHSSIIRKKYNQTFDYNNIEIIVYLPGHNPVLSFKTKIKEEIVEWDIDSGHSIDDSYTLSWWDRVVKKKKVLTPILLTKYSYTISGVAKFEESTEKITVDELEELYQMLVDKKKKQQENLLDKTLNKYTK